MKTIDRFTVNPENVAVGRTHRPDPVRLRGDVCVWLDGLEPAQSFFLDLLQMVLQGQVSVGKEPEPSGTQRMIKSLPKKRDLFLEATWPKVCFYLQPTGLGLIT